MRYLVFVKMAEDVGDAPPALVEAMGRAMGEAFAAGSMLDAGGLLPTAQSTQIRLAGGVATTLDGPFTEVSEVVGGYAIVQARSHAEAVEGARRVIELHHEHWPSWQGAVEIRQIAEPSDGTPTA